MVTRSLLTLPRARFHAALCALSVAGPLLAQAPMPHSGHSHPVLRVIDGDSVVLSLDGVETTVRLIGVDIRLRRSIHRSRSSTTDVRPARSS